MYFPSNISKQLLKSGGIELNYNEGRFFKKYELGYWEVFQNIHNSTRTFISCPYREFRPIYSTSNYNKAANKLEKIKNKSKF